MGLARIPPSPPLRTFHIIWNLLLADKTLTLTPEMLESEGIGHIVAILPNEEEFLLLNCAIPECPYTVMEYTGHTTSINWDDFHRVGSMIDKFARESKGTGRNILIFCNSGYQRSIPFLCYYLTQFHRDEVPTIEKALSIILSQVDRDNYMTQISLMTQQVTTLLHKPELTGEDKSFHYG